MLSPHDVVIGWVKDELIRVEPLEVALVAQKLRVQTVVDTITPFCAPGYRPDAQDTALQPLQSEWMLTSYPDYKQFLDFFGLKTYDAIKFDCDDYAYNYWVWCRNLYAKQETIGHAPCVGVCKYPGHVLNWALTDQGLKFFEPQTGKFVSNPQGIYWMKF